MMFDHLFPFLLACVVIELTPGPNMTYLAALSSIHGKKAGFSMVVGIASGLLLIGLVAAFGAAAIVLENPALYHGLRWIGIGYMLWLAWESWHASPISQESISHFDMRYFQRGFITNVFNPKAIIFYLTVFPTFIDLGRSVMVQSIVMTFLYVAVATIIHVIIAILADKTHGYLENPTIIRHTQRLFSFLLVGIAIWFAWSTR